MSTHHLFSCNFSETQGKIVHSIKLKLRGIVGVSLIAPAAVTTLLDSVVEWLKRRAYVQHGLGSKSTRAILLCPWVRHFTAVSFVWWSWQAILNYSHISIKLQEDSNILASPEAGRYNCLPYVLAPSTLSCEQGDKYRDKIKILMLLICFRQPWRAPYGQTCFGCTSHFSTFMK